MRILNTTLPSVIRTQNESRIRYLENMLKTATIVSDKSSSDEVGMDDIVEVYFEEDDEIEKYKHCYFHPGKFHGEQNQY